MWADKINVDSSLGCGPRSHRRFFMLATKFIKNEGYIFIGRMKPPKNIEANELLVIQQLYYLLMDRFD